MFYEKETNNYIKSRKIPLLYFSITIVAILVIVTSVSFLKLQLHKGFVIQDALARPSSESSKSTSNNLSLQNSSTISARSINNTNITAAESPPRINLTKMTGLHSELRLSLSKLAMDIPMQKGYEDKNEIYFVTFDASNSDLAKQITNNSNGFPVHYTKLLA